MPILYITDERNRGPDSMATYAALADLFNDKAEPVEILCADFENYHQYFMNSDPRHIPKIVYIDFAEADNIETERSIEEFSAKLQSGGVESVFATNCPVTLGSYAEKLGIFVIRRSEEKSQALSLIGTLAR